MKFIKGFETEVARISLIRGTDFRAYYVCVVGLADDNEHDVIKEFASIEEASSWYSAIYAVLVCNNVKIIKHFIGEIA